MFLSYKTLLANLVVLCFVLLGGMAGVSIIIWGFIRNKRKEERLQNQNNLLRMQALQTQMNPHFIFNVQAAIQGLWLRGSEEAALSLQNKFSKLLRKIFQYSGHLTISIEQLVEFLENYIALEKIRFKNEVQVEFEIDPSLLDGDYFVPPLLVQPIVENSFKHGLLHRENNRKLLIELKIILLTYIVLFKIMAWVGKVILNSI